MNFFKFSCHLGKEIFSCLSLSSSIVFKLIYFLFYGCRRDRQVLCLIFVERIITAKVVERFLKKITFLVNLTVSYLTGTGTSVDALAPKMQKENLESFRSGKVYDVHHHELTHM